LQPGNSRLIDPVETPGACAAQGNEITAQENLEMLRDRRVRHREFGRNFARCAFFVPDQSKDLSPCAIRQGS
jgi:hypothetical protein